MIVFIEEGDRKVLKSVSLSLFLLASTVAIAVSTGLGSQHSIVINEIHYDPDVKTELVEFVELHNTGIVDVDLAGWYFAGGISYEFPAGSTLPPGGYIIVAQDPVFIHAKWS
ncbi:MAG: lamin tail domain-containing protein, partial [Planctomycetota bacterium]